MLTVKNNKKKSIQALKQEQRIRIYEGINVIILCVEKLQMSKKLICAKLHVINHLLF